MGYGKFLKRVGVAGAKPRKARLPTNRTRTYRPPKAR